MFFSNSFLQYGLFTQILVNIMALERDVERLFSLLYFPAFAKLYVSSNAQGHLDEPHSWVTICLFLSPVKPSFE